MNPLSDHEFMELHQLRSCKQQQCFVFSDLGDLDYPVEIAKIKNGSIHSNYKAEHNTNLSPPPLKSEKQDESKRGRRCLSIFSGLILLIVLIVGIPIGLQLRSSSLLEARLSFVRRLLTESPLIGYWTPDYEHFNQSVREVQQNLVGAVLWPIELPCGAQYLDAVQLALEGIDRAKMLLDKDSTMTLAEDSEEMEQIFIKGDVAVLIGFEGSHAIGSSLAVLRSMHSLGIRFISLAGTACTTPFAKAASQKGVETISVDPEPVGLSEFGELVMHEMHRMGILVEISKMSEEGMILALLHAKAPLLMVDTAPASYCNVTSVPDHIISRLNQNGGIVMLNIEKCGDRVLTLKESISMINYVRSVVGIDHLGLSGSPSCYPQLLAELARDRLWGNAVIKKLVGGNLMRVLREVEVNRDRIPLSEDWIPKEMLESNSYCKYPEA